MFPTPERETHFTKYTGIGDTISGKKPILENVVSGLLLTENAGKDNQVGLQVWKIPTTRGHRTSPHFRSYHFDITWPFTWWRINILELFPLDHRQVMYLAVVVDYFTK